MANRDRSTAIQETSVVFGALIGRLFLGETLRPRHIVACVIVALGLLTWATVSNRRYTLIVAGFISFATPSFLILSYRECDVCDPRPHTGGGKVSSEAHGAYVAGQRSFVAADEVTQHPYGFD